MDGLMMGGALVQCATTHRCERDAKRGGKLLYIPVAFVRDSMQQTRLRLFACRFSHQDGRDGWLTFSL